MTTDHHPDVCRNRYEALARRISRLEHRMSESQASFDATVKTVQDALNVLQGHAATLDAEVAALKAANPQVDFSALEALAAQMTADAAADTAADAPPSPPAPTSSAG